MTCEGILHFDAKARRWSVPKAQRLSRGVKCHVDGGRARAKGQAPLQRAGRTIDTVIR